MPSYTQKKRFLYLTTPLGEDKLLLRSFRGEEGISRLFRFELELLAENSTEVHFDKLIGQKVSFGLNSDSAFAERDLHGIVVEFAQGYRAKEFTAFRMTIVPEIWKLSCKVRSRIFQQITIPDLLKKIFEGFDVSYETNDTYEPREYVVQYQESDLDFAARLMEEEGIFYFFKFTTGNHKLVITDTPHSHPDLPSGASVIFEDVEGGKRNEERVTSWLKRQNWGPGKYALWDHHFQLPHKHLDTQREVLDSVTVGKVAHKLKLSGNSDLEIYENPGRYAQRFDGINKTGGEQAGELQKIFTDNDRTVKLRAQQGEAAMIVIQGEGSHRNFTAGHKFTLTRHFDGNGKYVLLSVSHEAKEADFSSNTGGGGGEEGHYANSFTCIPYADPYRFRPARITRRPVLHGPQSAVVVGPAGEEIFTDKYGRVKVQFHWDREGQNDAVSSCWLRVATSWAGKNWGSIHIPRIGQEVIVSFLEGDPDRPILTGSVYNTDMMPPYALPDHKTISTIKSRSSKQGTANNFNELRFEDKKDNEQVFLHAERDMDVRVKRESREIIGADRHLDVGHDQTEEVANDKASKVGNNYSIETANDQQETIAQNHVVSVGTDMDWIVGANRTEDVGANLTLSVGADQNVSVGMNHALDAGQSIHVKAGMSVVIEAGMQLTLKGPGGFITIDPSGVAIQGNIVLINSGGAAGSGPGVQKKKPKKPEKPKKPVKADDGSKRGPLS